MKGKTGSTRACTTMKFIKEKKKETTKTKKINKSCKPPHQQARFHTVAAKKVSEIISEMLILREKKMTLV